MTKEKLMLLEAYRSIVRAKLHGVIPVKHTSRSTEYKAYLSRELKQVDLKLESYRLAGKEEKVGGK